MELAQWRRWRGEKDQEASIDFEMRNIVSKD